MHDSWNMITMCTHADQEIQLKCFYCSCSSGEDKCPGSQLPFSFLCNAWDTARIIMQFTEVFFSCCWSGSGLIGWLGLSTLNYWILHLYPNTCSWAAIICCLLIFVAQSCAVALCFLNTLGQAVLQDAAIFHWLTHLINQFLTYVAKCENFIWVSQVVPWMVDRTTYRNMCVGV